MSWILDILRESWTLYYLAAPFILFGVVMAGALQVLLSPRQVVEWMGKPGMTAVCRAALLGVPLPLCSCGVFPVSIALRRKGATAPATMSFLVTTPETSADAIVLTWALLGPIMAIFRPIAAFFTGGLAGALAIAFPPTGILSGPDEPIDCGCGPRAGSTDARCDPKEAGARSPEDTVGPEDHEGHDHSSDLEGSDFVGFRATGRAILRALHIGGSRASSDSTSTSESAAESMSTPESAADSTSTSESAAESTSTPESAAESTPESTSVVSPVAYASEDPRIDVLPTENADPRQDPPLREICARIGRQAFLHSMDDIVFWLTIGLILAGAIEVLLPPEIIAGSLGSGILPMLLVVVIAMPMYVCASSSTPVAAALIAKGLSPGTALVFLLAGPAASTASMLLIARHFGGRFLRIYLSAVVVGSVISGLALDFLLARTGWRIIPQLSSQTEGFVAFVQLVLVIFLTGLILWRLWAGAFRMGIREAKENFDAAWNVVGTLTRGTSPGRKGFRLNGRMAWVLISILLLVQLGSGFVVIPPDSAGYAKIFGKIVAHDLAPGLHWYPPAPFGETDVWRVHYPRKSDVGFQTSLDLIARRKELRRQAPPTEWHSPITAMNANTSITSYLTGDENLVELSFTVHYFLSDPYAFFYTATKDRDWVGLYAESVARELIGRQALDALLTAERYEIEASLEEILQQRLDELGIGVRIDSVHIVDLHPPQGAVNAFRDVSSAREDRQTRIHNAYEVQARELPLARGAAILDVAREKADAVARVADARGKAAGYSARSRAYRVAPAILHDLLWIETAERVLAGRGKFIVPPGTEVGTLTLWKLNPPLPTLGAEENPKEP